MKTLGSHITLKKQPEQEEQNQDYYFVFLC